MTTATRPPWTRERARSGPGDTLDDRFEIRRTIIGRAHRWIIVDRELVDSEARPNGVVGHPGGYPTMRLAREEAERIAGYRRGWQ